MALLERQELTEPLAQPGLHFIDGESGVWSRAKPSFRREVLMRVADLIDARADDGIKNSGVGREGGGGSRGFFTESRFVSFPLTPR